MNFLAFGTIFAQLIWSLFYMRSLFYIFLLIVIIYSVLNFIKSQSYKNSFRRKIAIASWIDGGNPRATGRLEFDMTAVDAAIEKHNSLDKQRVYKVIFFAKAFAMATKIVKKTLGKLSFGNFLSLSYADFCIQVQIKKGEIGHIVLRNCDTRSIQDLSSEYEQKFQQLKQGRNQTHNFHKKWMNKTPTFIVQAVLRVAMFLTYDLGLSLPFFHMEKETYGTMTVIDNEEFGLSDCIGPLNPIMRQTLLVCLNKPNKKPVVVDQKLEIRNIMVLHVSFDHRFADGADGSKLVDQFQGHINQFTQRNID